MATEPKRKTSKARSRRRRAANMRIEPPGLMGCPNCGNRVLRHRVCPKCGHYRGRQVLEPEEMA